MLFQDDNVEKFELFPVANFPDAFIKNNSVI